jgi:hypothetical protein
MSGSKTNAMNRNEVLAAVRAAPPERDFVWDGVDEDDRPATDEELRAGLALARNRGRPVGSDKHRLHYALIIVCWRPSALQVRAGKRV